MNRDLAMTLAAVAVGIAVSAVALASTLIAEDIACRMGRAASCVELEFHELETMAVPPKR
jgi:hypothetical protein